MESSCPAAVRTSPALRALWPVEPLPRATDTPFSLARSQLWLQCSPLALRELRGLGRSEQAFFNVLTALMAGEVNWSEVASNNGFTDQSHMCRQTRSVTGFAPEELRRRISSEEGFWAYRLWGYSEGQAED